MPTSSINSKNEESCMTKNEQEVMRTISRINIQKLEEAIRIITASRRLILFARGFSEMVAQEMMIKFQLT